VDSPFCCYNLVCVAAESKTFAALELLCVFFWFVLDGFWLMEWRQLTYAFSALAIGTGLAMFFFIAHQLPVILVACADFSWLLTNILWAVGDLSEVKPAIGAARVLFWVGLVICGAAAAAAAWQRALNWDKSRLTPGASLVLARLRILQLFKR
jgi:hypothetical protein